MATYGWCGSDLDGRHRHGLTPATDPGHLRRQLGGHGIAVEYSIRMPGWLERVLTPSNPRLRSRHINALLRQLATLSSAGVPLIDAMAMVAREDRQPGLRRLASELRDEIATGTPLSVAFATQPAHFDPLVCGLIRAGEQSGELDTLLERIANDRECTAAIRHRLRRAMLYPLIVLGVALVVSTALLMFVVPRFEALFHGFGAELPTFTRHVIGLSTWLRSDGWLGLIGAVGGTAAWLVLTRHYTPLRQIRHRIVLRIPITGGLVERAETARFARTLAILMQAGAPLAEALPTVAGTLGTLPYQRAVMRITDDLRDGRSLAFAVERTQRFEASTARMIATGEAAGRLPGVLERIADRQEAELSQGIETLGTAIEPLIMSILGLLIGGLVLAMYLPVFQLGSVI
ncbi:type II secretion system F family protein [Spiribacter vilamensis]|uniref:Type IV pilus assembly protein PilC n=1 Tax=Spiribacter vilamensis TaxID=531306 RepID=A0A4Q8CYG8_9GAMM|nr:type II secretion system F family protein [Spiribacter vilamensis]RZU97927.1 type IV pilus assembly protein PilC [Spiribacter vilamensis]